MMDRVVCVASLSLHIFQPIYFYWLFIFDVNEFHTRCTFNVSDQYDRCLRYFSIEWAKKMQTN